MSNQEFVVISGSAPDPDKAAAVMTQDIGGPHLGGPAVASAAPGADADERELAVQLEQLRQEHRDLDAAIEALAHTAGVDRLQVQRLKKRKLMLRDRIVRIEDQLTPDIIA